jgi:porphobilinogen synthase
MSFPTHRGRRLRYNPALRRMVRETRFAPEQLIYPLFVRPGDGVEDEIGSMPGQYQLSIDTMLKKCEMSLELGLGGVILFGIPAEKDGVGSDAMDDEGIVQQAVRAAKSRFPELLVITDLCMCEYTDHGHCGQLKDGDVDNDETLELLAASALAQARAGADVVAPSDMMDGRVGRVRHALDENGFEKIPILSYAAKFASSFYGPFREAAESAPKQGDRKSYQMDPMNGREAIKEVAMDIEEGADMVMVKPALSYMDIISTVKDLFDVPVFAYNVSGEYSLVKAAAKNGWVDEEKIMMEMLGSIFRAGADGILTYFAPEAARLLRQEYGR